MKVLHLVAGNLYGGVERLLTTFARQRQVLLQAEFGVCFEGLLASELRALGASVHILGGARASRPVTVVHARRKLRQLLRERPIDVVLCHATWPLAVFGPVVLSSSDVSLVCWMHDATTGRHWIDRWARRNVPSLIIYNSRYTRDRSRHLFPKTRSEVIYCPVEAPLSLASPETTALVRRELETPLDATVVIQVGRMESWKGHLLHLEALQNLAHLPNWICWMVGGPQRPFEEVYFERLRQFAAKNAIADRIRFAGFRTDVPRLLAAADIFCQPNTGPEPFGVVFAEALQAGLPVVTTAIGGALEIVDSTCGILFAKGDVEGLTTALRQLFEDGELRTRLGRAAPQRARAICDPQNQNARLTELLGEVVEQSKRATRPQPAGGLDLSLDRR